MTKHSSTFAFRLAERTPQGKGQWAARKGQAVAGCTEVIHFNYRYGKVGSPDSGVYC